MAISNKKKGIILLTFATVVIHFYMNIPMGKIDFLFTANGFGYLALLFLLLVPMGFLENHTAKIYWVYMGYTAVTIVAWLIIGDKSFSPIGLLGYFDKIFEVLLISLLWSDFQEYKANAP